MATTLNVGDLALIGYSSDTAGKSFAFVLLRDIEAGTEIGFTDNGWLEAGGFRSGEGVSSYTAPAEGARAGQVITISGLTGQFNPSTSGDQIIAYQGAATSPTPLFALDFADGNATYAATAANSNTSAVPAGLSFGSTALAFGTDNGAYAGPTGGSQADLLASIADPANWTLDDAAPRPYVANFTVDGGEPGDLPTVSIGDLAVDEADGSATFTVSLSAASTETVTVAYATADETATAGSDYTAGAGTVTFAPGATTATITIPVTDDAAQGEGDERFSVTLTDPTNARLGDAQATATIRDDDFREVRISEVQGSGTASGLVGQTVTIEAVVVGDFQNGDADGQRNLGGFYLQEETGDQDSDAATSEGLFVYEGSGAFRADVAEGDRVRITGTVSEFNGETQFNVTGAANVEVVKADAVADVGSLAVKLDLPTTDLEAYEGMLVTIPQALTVTEQFNLDRFNEIELYAGEGDGRGGAVDETAGERPYQFTQTNDPDAAGYAQHLRDLAARTITYDDGLNTQNQPIDVLDGFDPDDDGVGASAADPLEPGYGTDTAPRMGDTVTDLTGVLGFGPAGAYRVRSVENGDNNFESANPRQDAPEDVGGRLQVGSFNVLNYFTTLNAGGAETTNGFEPRGANSEAEFERQTDKLVDSILGLDADVLALVEIENDFIEGSSGNAVAYLVDELNAAAGETVYDWVRPGEDFVGGDAIAVGTIYKPDTVRVSMDTSIEILDDSDVRPELLAESTIGSIFNGVNTSRAALAVTFEEISSGERFTTVANHFKSKSGSGTGEDADQQDGAGAWNNQRELAARALTEWLASDPTASGDGDVMVLGDLNAYFEEDPIDILEAAGFENVQERIEDPYSYVFDGQVGSLDYAMTSDSLSDQVTGVTEWHINADEADALDYNLDFGRDPDYFDGDAPARVSDHDPLLVGLDLGEPTRTIAGTKKGDVFVDDPSFSTTYLAGKGNDFVRGRDGADILVGGDGNDLLSGGSGVDRVSGDKGKDVLSGDEGDDFLFGGDDKDALAGGSGRDRLSGDKGDDALVGGADADQFVFAKGDGRDIVLDFDFEEGDRLEIADGMRLTGFQDFGDDRRFPIDATELQFNGSSVTLVGVSGVKDFDEFFA